VLRVAGHHPVRALRPIDADESLLTTVALHVVGNELDACGRLAQRSVAVTLEKGAARDRLCLQLREIGRLRERDLGCVLRVPRPERAVLLAFYVPRRRTGAPEGRVGIADLDHVVRVERPVDLVAAAEDDVAALAVRAISEPREALLGHV